MHKPGDPLPRGWRLTKGGNALPPKGTKAYAIALKELQRAQGAKARAVRTAKLLAGGGGGTLTPEERTARKRERDKKYRKKAAQEAPASSGDDGLTEHQRQRKAYNKKYREEHKTELRAKSKRRKMKMNGNGDATIDAAHQIMSIDDIPSHIPRHLMQRGEKRIAHRAPPLAVNGDARLMLAMAVVQLVNRLVPRDD